jgi:hypothetical protein
LWILRNRKNFRNNFCKPIGSIGNLAGGIAHDFNNILTTVTGYAGLLQQQVEGTHPLMPYVVVRVHSEPSKGSRFDVYLPLCSERMSEDRPVVEFADRLRQIRELLNGKKTDPGHVAKRVTVLGS